MGGDGVDTDTVSSSSSSSLTVEGDSAEGDGVVEAGCSTSVGGVDEVAQALSKVTLMARMNNILVLI